MPENSGNAGPGCWPRPIPAEQSNPPRVKLVQATGEDGRTAIGGILYTFLSAYRRLAPSGLRRFILQSRSPSSPPRSSTRQAAPTSAEEIWLERALRGMHLLRAAPDSWPRLFSGCATRPMPRGHWNCRASTREIAVAKDHPAVENASWVDKHAASR